MVSVYIRLCLFFYNIQFYGESLSNIDAKRYTIHHVRVEVVIYEVVYFLSRREQVVIKVVVKRTHYYLLSTLCSTVPQTGTDKST